jgi:hypothetical protein
VLAARRKILTSDLRMKVKEMKEANKNASASHSKEQADIWKIYRFSKFFLNSPRSYYVQQWLKEFLQIAPLMTRLRMLMSKDWVKAMPSEDEQEANLEVFSLLLNHLLHD